MYSVFWLTFTAGALPMAWMESLFDGWADLIGDYGRAASRQSWKSLAVDGIIGGVAGC